jgi:hypothetical protein
MEKPRRVRMLGLDPGTTLKEVENDKTTGRSLLVCNILDSEVTI